MNKCMQIGSLNMSYDQSGRVYSIKGISPTVMGNSHGKTTGGYNAVKVLISNINYKINNRSDKMYKNNLEKFNFKMEELRLFDSFAGIGALHQSLKELGVPIKVVGLSEVDIDAIISYAAIHIDNFKDLEFEYPSDDEMKRYLMDRNIGYDFDKQRSSIPRLKKDKLYKCYKACILTNNLGDIGNLDYNNIPDFDLFNFSFCCQDISVAGKQKGLKNEDGTPTRSGLVKYGIEVIKAKKPKYIMIENVKNLIGKKFIDDFYGIINEIKDLGYNCYYPTKKDNTTPTCLNAKDFRIPQNRERIFIICVKKDADNNNFKFPIGKDYGIRLKDLLEDNVDEKYYLSQEIQDRFKLNVIDDSTTDYKQPKQTIDADKLSEDGKTICEFRCDEGIRYFKDNVCGTIRTIDSGRDKRVIEVNNDNKAPNPELVGGIGEMNFGKQFRQGNRIYSSDKTAMCLMAQPVGNTGGYSYLYETNFKIRKLTPKECWRLMGFRDEHVDRVRELGISDSSLYKQAGNSIVVNVLYYIFKNLFKEYII